MPISRYAKVLLLAPSIGSALIGVFGLLLGIVLIAHHGQAGNRTIADTTHRTTLPARPSISPEIVGPALMPTAAAASSEQPRLLRVSSKPARTTHSINQQAAPPALPLQSALFQKPIPPDELAFLKDYAGHPASDILHEQRLRELVTAVVPYTAFHFGLDMPLPHVVESMFSTSQVPVEILDGRYVMVTGIRGHGGRGRTFIWVDMQQGIALGGVFFYPSNGEPTPTLTIFSSQVAQKSLALTQLPPAFVQELTGWSTAQGLPVVTTRYFINAATEKTVLAHDEDFCKFPAAGIPALSDSCARMNADAARLDAEAAHFLGRTNYASNATMRTADEKSRIGATIVR